MSGFLFPEDRFVGGVGPLWRTPLPASVRVNGSNQLEVDAVNGWSSFIDTPPLDWTNNGGRELRAEVLTVPTVTGSEAAMQARVDSSNMADFQVIGGTLRARRAVAGTYAMLKSVAYNATNHKWWSLLVDGPNLVWRTCPDALVASPAWTVLHTEALPINMAAATARLMARDPAGTAGQRLTVDNVNRAYEAPPPVIVTPAYGLRTPDGRAITLQAAA